MNSSKARGSVLSSVKRKDDLHLIAQPPPVDHRALAPGSRPPPRSRSSRRQQVAGVTPARSASSAVASARVGQQLAQDAPVGIVDCMIFPPIAAFRA